jgi:hypothetical protein
MLMLCPICGEEFDSPVDDCPACGCSLVPMTMDPAFPTPPPDETEIHLVELCRPRSYVVAMLIKQMLRQNGVAAMVQGEHSLSVQPHLAFGGEMRVLVEEQRLEFARDLYRAYFENEGGDYIEEDE